MIDINELIQELLVSVEGIIYNDWNPQNLDSEKSKVDYKELVSELTDYTISRIKVTDLTQDLLSMENSMNNVIPNLTRCESVAKKLKKELETIMAKQYYKGRRERREKMNKALKEITIPFIRNKGFKGTFPNFTKVNEIEVVSLKFQFSQFSSQFVVELNSSTKGKIRHRLGSHKNQKDYWYDFNAVENSEDIYRLRAEEIIANWDEFERWNSHQV